MPLLPRQNPPLHYLSIQLLSIPSSTVKAATLASHTDSDPLCARKTHSATFESLSMPRKKQHKPPPTKRPPPTHFLALPLSTPNARVQLEESLGRFRDAVVINDGVHVATASRDEGHPPTATTDITTTEADMRAVGADNTLNSATSQNEPATYAKEETRVVPPGAIRPVGTIHFTLGVMHLPTPSDVERAVAFLQNLDLAPLTVAEPTSLPPQHLTIDLVNLRPLPSASKATVLYIEPAAGESRERLQRLAQGLKDAFVTAEPTPLVMEEKKGREEVLLHATVVNTIYARKGARKGMGRERVSMDVRGLVGGGEGERMGGQEGQKSVETSWGDTVWAKEVKVGRLCICEMGAEKVWAPSIEARMGEKRVVVDEVYKEVAGVDIPW